METMDLQTVKIYEAISSIMSAIDPIAKNKKNTQQGYLFRGIDSVYGVLNPMLIANKVIIIPETLSHEITQFESKNGGNLFRVVVTMKYKFVHCEDGSTFDVIMTGEGMDSGDKATSKAQSMAYKYMAFQLFCIPVDTGDDTENTTHEVATTQPNQAPQPKANEPEKWLNEMDKQGNITPEWNNMLSAIEMGTLKSITEIRKYYKVAKKEAEKIENLLKK